MINEVSRILNNSMQIGTNVGALIGIIGTVGLMMLFYMFGVKCDERRQNPDNVPTGSGSNIGVMMFFVMVVFVLVAMGAWSIQ